jgi:Fic family protein
MMPYPTYLRLQLLKFDFIKKAYFYPSVIDIEKDIKTIHDIHLRLEGLLTAAILDADDKGCCDYLEATYLREVWVAESPTSLTTYETEEISLSVVEGHSCPNGVPERSWLKLQNLKAAMDHLRGNLSTGVKNPVDISLDLVKCVHKIVGNDLIPSAGEFRQNHVGAAGTGVTYLAPTSISPRLALLMKFINDEVASYMLEKDGFSKLKKMLRLASMFFSEFLKIHPFINGNGRVARLLVNFLLSRVSFVPISIFLDDSYLSNEKKSFRETYLDLVGQAQWHDNQGGLTTIFLLSAKRTAMKAEYLMLSDTDE